MRRPDAARSGPGGVAAALAGGRPGAVRPGGYGSGMTERAADDLVVGAGVVGLTTALLLARGGHRVTVVTAEPVGGGSTGRSAGVVSRLHGTTYRRLSGETARRNAAAYRAAQDAGFGLLADLLTARDVPHERRDAYLAALRPDGARRIDDEHLAAQRAGLRLEKAQRAPLPFDHHGALRLPDQIRVDPDLLLAALASAAEEAGVRIVAGARVTDVRVRPAGGSLVETAGETFESRRVVLATGTPILDRGLYAFKTQAFRLMAVAGSGQDPALPIVTAIGPGGSTTLATDSGGRTIAIGQAHPVGTNGPESRRRAALEQTIGGLLPGFEAERSWSGQDYRPFNPIAFVGALPRTGGAVSFATGFDGWGLTHGAAAGIRLADALLGEPQRPWAKTIGRRATRPVSVGIGIAADVRRASVRVAGFRRLAPADLQLLEEGHGVVHRTDAGAIATSRVGGGLRSVHASCSRAGGAVVFNDVERSWDCPVCGSRFDVTGAVLEGGARGPLLPAAWPGTPQDRAPDPVVPR